MLLSPLLLIAAFLGTAPLSEQGQPPAVALIQQQEADSVKTAKLVHMKSNFTVVEFVGENTIIHDKILEKEMTERGVLIPPALRGLYQGKEAIRLGEEGFQKAFKEIFCANIFSGAHYSWQE